MSQFEEHYVNRSNWIRAAVLGANDGILSVSSIAVGVASATGKVEPIAIASLAGLVAGALSMAAGEYVSVSSQADIEAADIAREAKELEEMPELEEKELLHFFKGLTLALVTITSLATIIGYKLYYLLPSDIVSIPVFIMPLYLTILMLRAVEIYYRVAVISGGIICPILFPYFGDWSLIIAGLCGGTLGLGVNHFLNKSKANA